MRRPVTGFVAAIAFCAALEACAWQHARAESFACSGTTAPAPKTWTRAEPAPGGRLLVRELTQPPAADAGVELEDRRLQVLAEGVPLGHLAARLSEALGLTVVASGEVAHLRVDLAADDTSVQGLFDLLRSTHDVRVHHPSAGWESRRRLPDVWLVSAEHAARLSGAGTKRREPVQLFIEVKGRHEKQLAAALCEQVLTPEGSAVVVGHTVIVKDLPSSMPGVRGLAEVMGDVPSPEPAFDAGRPGAASEPDSDALEDAGDPE